MTSVKAILFDFDGTLANTVLGITKTMAETFQRMEIPIPSEEEMIATIGLPLRTSLQRLGKLSDAQADEATALYRELFPIYEVGNVVLFPDTISTLEKLKERGVRMAIVTSRDCPSLRLIMEPRGLLPFFETTVNGSDGIKAKPAPDMVVNLLERMSLKADEVLAVGDTTFDIEMGQRAGCKTCAVTYGNHSRETLASLSPTHIIDSLSELLSLPELQ